MNNSKTKNIARIAIVASLYVALTYAFGWMAYGAIQFRLAEVLVLLCFFKKDYSVGLIIGCLIANIFSPLGIIDVFCGTLATTLAVIGVMSVKNLYVAAVFPVIANAVIVGIELWYVFESPIALNMLTVGIGELVVMILGVMIFLNLSKNKSFMILIDANQKN